MCMCINESSYDFSFDGSCGKLELKKIKVFLQLFIYKNSCKASEFIELYNDLYLFSENINCIKQFWRRHQEDEVASEFSVAYKVLPWAKSFSIPFKITFQCLNKLSQ